nr:MAG TPA: Lipopolysaccharide assembly protein A domain [Caudoviricetes sp.]
MWEIFQLFLLLCAGFLLAGIAAGTLLVIYLYFGIFKQARQDQKEGGYGKKHH